MVLIYWDWDCPHIIFLLYLDMLTCIPCILRSYLYWNRYYTAVRPFLVLNSLWRSTASVGHLPCLPLLVEMFFVDIIQILAGRRYITFVGPLKRAQLFSRSAQLKYFCFLGMALISYLNFNTIIVIGYLVMTFSLQFL